MDWEIHKSEIDSSVNFTRPYGKGFVECRFVQRCEDQIIVYVSSHSGCKQACRFCHLTATGQTDETPVTIDGFVDQLNVVLDYWRTIKSGKETRININWMARGEPLNNPHIIDDWAELSTRLIDAIQWDGLTANMNISTILPNTLKEKDLVGIFGGGYTPRIYYSLYSTNEQFRKKWLPKAKPVHEAIDYLTGFADILGGDVIVHQAFIKDHNDDDTNIYEIRDFTTRIPNARVNIVRYNPHSDRHGEETDRIEEIAEMLSDTHTQVVPRVGMDVKASCGMFISP